MNIKMKLIACCLVLASVFTSENSIAATCAKSGFGAGLSVALAQNKVKIDPSKIKDAKSKEEESKITKIKEAMHTLQTKTGTKNDANTEMENSSTKWNLNTYSAQNIQNASSSSTLPTADKRELTFKVFKGNNPTRYRMYTDPSQNPTKYDSNGMINANTGAKIENYPIYVSPGILTDNNYQNPVAPQGNPTSDTKVVGNYATIQDNNGTYNITPRDAVILTEMNQAIANNLPTHARLDEIKSTDPIAYRLMTKMYANETTKKAWETQLGADNWVRFNNNLYIKTADKTDWGINDALITNSLSTLGNTSSVQTFSDAHKWTMDLLVNIFYQFRIFDWFVRAGISGTLPLMNKEISLVKDSNSSSSSSSDKSSDKKNKSSTDFSLKHKWDMGVQLLAGYNITQMVSLVLGGEAVYHKYELTNIDKFYSAYQINTVLSEVLGETASTDWQKAYGYDGNKTKEFGKWSFNGIAGLEFNWNNFIVGAYCFFGPSLKLLKTTDKNSFGSLTVTNVGLRVGASYIF